MLILEELAADGLIDLERASPRARGIRSILKLDDSDRIPVSDYG